MTVITAMDCGSSLVIAADSQVTENGLRLIRDKLDYIGDPPLAWWCAGDEAFAVEFGRWVRRHPWETTPTWVQFGDAAVTEFARLNRVKRDRVAMATGREPQERELAHALVAGYIGDEPEILEMDHKGGRWFTRSYGFAAIGSGRALAWTALKTLEEVRGPEFRHDEATFRLMMGVVVRLADICSPPVRILRLTTEGVEELAPIPA